MALNGNALKTYDLIAAVDRVSKSITEEDIHIMADALPEDKRIEFASAMTDLGIAFQDYMNV